MYKVSISCTIERTDGYEGEGTSNLENFIDMQQVRKAVENLLDLCKDRIPERSANRSE
jgi:hypothetical protein